MVDGGKQLVVFIADFIHLFVYHGEYGQEKRNIIDFHLVSSSDFYWLFTHRPFMGGIGGFVVCFYFYPFIFSSLSPLWTK